MQPTAASAIEALRHLGIAGDVRARLLHIASERDDPAEDALARAGCAIPAIAADPSDRVTIGAALLTEMSHQACTPRARAQVQTGLEMLGRGTHEDVHVQQTTFRGVLEEDHAVRVPLPSTESFLRLPVEGRDPVLNAHNRTVVESLQQRAAGHRSDIPRFKALYETEKASAERVAEADTWASRATARALCATIAGGLVTPIGLVGYLAFGSTTAGMACLAGLSTVAVAYPVLHHLFTKSEKLNVDKATAEREARIAEIRQRNAEDGLASVERDLAIAVPLVDKHENQARAREMEQFVRQVAAPRTDARVETAETHVTIAGVRVERRTE